MQSEPMPPGIPYRTSAYTVVTASDVAGCGRGPSGDCGLGGVARSQAGDADTGAADAHADGDGRRRKQLFVEDADRSLCQAIVPLMEEVGEQNKLFGALAPGSPEQGAAIPGYRSFIEGWATRIQDVLNSHASPPRYLTRTLQAYIDDKLLYVELAEPGRVDPGDQLTWNQASIDGGGPLSTCRQLGITW